jgi:hypothetical protein
VHTEFVSGTSAPLAGVGRGATLEICDVVVAMRRGSSLAPRVKQCGPRHCFRDRSQPTSRRINESPDYR